MECTKAYVVGRSCGRIKESPVKMGGTSTADKGPEHDSGIPLSLDIEGEFDLVEKTLAKIRKQDSSMIHTEITSSVKDNEAKHLKELGLARLVTIRITVSFLHIDVILKRKSLDSLIRDGHLSRARRFGWPNTYSFTKAMGEKLLENLRGNLPVVIIRPTIIESTLAEPFPGWMEGTRSS